MTSRICVIGATGWLGGAVVTEALERGHSVTGILRDPARAEVLDPRAGTAQANVTDGDALARAFTGHDAIFGAYRAPSEDPDEMPKAAGTAIAAARRAGVSRIVWTGGTGVLKIPGGERDIVDLPEFPSDWKAAALAHREALNTFRRDATDLDWTYVSVPRVIEPGERTGSYRVGQDTLLLDERGESRITAEDFAVAVVDLLESGAHARAHITFAG
jgi:putative NADH-flavin reductase